MTKDDMIALVRRHQDAEVAQDYPGIMATLCAQPRYEIYPAGYQVLGCDAVLEMYKRLLPAIFPYVVESDAMTFGTAGAGGKGASGMWVGDSGVVIRESAVCAIPGKGRIRISEVAIFYVTGDLLLGETFYCDAPLARLFEEALGEDFLSIRGVTRLTP